jgi:hypothetical protein
MINFLLLAKQEIEKSGLPCAEHVEYWKASYMRILKYGELELRHSFPSDSQTKRKGKQKQHPTKNLWDRLYRYQESVLSFIRNCRFRLTITRQNAMYEWSKRNKRFPVHSAAWKVQRCSVEFVASFLR